MVRSGSSGVEWSGEECRGVRWKLLSGLVMGVTCSGVVWSEVEWNVMQWIRLKWRGILYVE
jgi:hypothetical protein